MKNQFWAVGRWSGLDCEIKGSGPIMSNFWGLFFHFFGAQKKIKFFFDPKKVKKRASKVAHNRPRPFYFTVQPRPTAHSPELIFHIMKSWDQTSVLLSVGQPMSFFFENWWCRQNLAFLFLIIERIQTPEFSRVNLLYTLCYEIPCSVNTMPYCFYFFTPSMQCNFTKQTTLMETAL